MALRGMVTLDRAWLTLASDPTYGVTAGTAGSVGGGGTRSDNYELTGTFRQYANGVTRLISGTQTNTQEVLAFRALTPAQVRTLMSMVGKTCLFRDTYGRRMYVSFLATQATDIPLSGRANHDLLTDVGFTLTQVTYDEGV